MGVLATRVFSFCISVLKCFKEVFDEARIHYVD
jgi:hypothetical protein